MVMCKHINTNVFTYSTTYITTADIKYVYSSVSLIYHCRT